MTKHHLLLAILSLGLSLVATPAVHAANTKPVTTYRVDHRQVYVYGRAATLHQRRKVPSSYLCTGPAVTRKKKPLPRAGRRKLNRPTSSLFHPAITTLSPRKMCHTLRKLSATPKAIIQSIHSGHTPWAFPMVVQRRLRWSTVIRECLPALPLMAGPTILPGRLHVTQFHSSSFLAHGKQPSLLKMMIRWCGSMSGLPFAHYSVITR